MQRSENLGNALVVPNPTEICSEKLADIPIPAEGFVVSYIVSILPAQ
jgi:hypothetical protein